jgi:hypothetical protein
MGDDLGSLPLIAVTTASVEGWPSRRGSLSIRPIVGRPNSSARRTPAPSSGFGHLPALRSSVFRLREPPRRASATPKFARRTPRGVDFA